MGRRRKRYEEPGLMEEVLDLAWASPVVGGIFSGALLLVAGVLAAWPSSPQSPVRFMLPLMGLMLGMIGGFGLLVSAIGFLRDVFKGR